MLEGLTVVKDLRLVGVDKAKGWAVWTTFRFEDVANLKVGQCKKCVRDWNGSVAPKQAFSKKSSLH